MTQGHLAGAAFDVPETEPPPDDSPLMRAWRDPSHSAYAAFDSEEGLDDMWIKGSQNGLRGERPRNVVN